jgi:hypothetical protein
MLEEDSRHQACEDGGNGRAVLFENCVRIPACSHDVRSGTRCSRCACDLWHRCACESVHVREQKHVERDYAAWRGRQVCQASQLFCVQRERDRPSGAPVEEGGQCALHAIATCDWPLVTVMSKKSMTALCRGGQRPGSLQSPAHHRETRIRPGTGVPWARSRDLLHTPDMRC